MEPDDDVSSRSTPTQPVPRPSTTPPSRLSEPIVKPDDGPHIISRGRALHAHRLGARTAHRARLLRRHLLIFPEFPCLCPPPPPNDLLNSCPSSRRPQLSGVRSLASKSQLHLTDGDAVLVARRPPRHLNTGDSTPSAAPPRHIYVPMSMRPWVLRTGHATTSFHLGVSSTVSMLARFFSWIGMNVSARWWIRRCLN